MTQSSDWAAGMGGWLRGQFAPLAERALDDMTAEGEEETAVTLHRSLDMRYLGQSHELTVDLPDLTADPVERFHAAHEARFGYRQPGAEVEIVTVRITAVAVIIPPTFPSMPPGGTEPAAARLGEKRVWFGGQPRTAVLYDREKLRPNQRFLGPAIVFQYDTTTVIPPGWETAVDTAGNLIVSRANQP